MSDDEERINVESQKWIISLGKKPQCSIEKSQERRNIDENYGRTKIGRKRETKMICRWKKIRWLVLRSTNHWSMLVFVLESIQINKSIDHHLHLYHRKIEENSLICFFWNDLEKELFFDIETMSSTMAASLRRILLLGQCSKRGNVRSFSMNNKDVDKAAHPFDYVNQNYSKIFSIFKSLTSIWVFPIDFWRHHILGGHYTLANIHDNTLFFHVESNFGVRRSDFARRLADHIGFLAIPKPDIDRMLFVNETGTVNTRIFHNDYCLPRDFIPKPEEWHLNPNHHATLRMLRPLLQTMTYQLRMGLSHMFSTGFIHWSSLPFHKNLFSFKLGQGIVTDRSYWSFYAILNILRDFGFVSQDGNFIRSFLFFFLLLLIESSSSNTNFVLTTRKKIDEEKS